MLSNGWEYSNSKFEPKVGDTRLSRHPKIIWAAPDRLDKGELSPSSQHIQYYRIECASRVSSRDYDQEAQGWKPDSNSLHTLEGVGYNAGDSMPLQEEDAIYYPGEQSTEFPSATQPWTHHHHSSPSAFLSASLSQDRYVCTQCTKTFSRPSSLRIHSHSHTGEKPFVCPRDGCGKAFSVRSNMKRHERGCHQAIS